MSNGPAKGKAKTVMTADAFMQNELPQLAEVVSFCNNLPISLYADMTGVKSPEVSYRGLLLSRVHGVADDYLLNARRSESDIGIVVGVNNYGLPSVQAAIATRGVEEDEDAAISLPKPKTLRAPLGPVVRSRRSVREYKGKPVTLAELATILFHGGGVTGELRMPPGAETVTLGPCDQMALRAVASGGGLYPVDLYIIATAVKDLDPAIYRYAPDLHALMPVAKAPPAEELRNLAQFGDIDPDKAAVMVAYVYKQYENARKYGDAAMGFAYMEVGGMANSMHLACTALGVGSCCIGGIAKRRFEKALRADGLSRHMIHLTVIGK
ncbi:MAG: SagB/ThcOx family dehydrogenase [Paracoccaceae bacterium]